jgi:ribose-phosphate pyrophosphokinase
MKIHKIRIPEDNSILYSLFTYPAGEVQVRMNSEQAKLIDRSDEVEIISRSSFIKTAMLVDCVREVIGGRRIPVSLVFPYLPYARADRRFTPADCFGLKVFGDMINMTGCDRVLALDVHSHAAKSCIANFVNIGVEPIIASVVAQLDDVTILLPDEGSVDRYNLLFAQKLGIPVLHCQKKRDVTTGALLEFTVPIINTKRVLIVDDICDGGGTFKGIAQKIREQQKDHPELYLYVTHGIFSKGVDLLLEDFTKVYCTDSFTYSPKRPNLCVFPTEKLVEDKLTSLKKTSRRKL